MAEWVSKIVGHEKVSPESLLANPRNARIHTLYQQDMLNNLIDDIGFIKSVQVNVNTGAVVDGHLRVAQALKREVSLIDVEYVDLTEAQEAKAVAAADWVGGLAGVDKEKLSAIYAELGRGTLILEKMAEDLGIELTDQLLTMDIMGKKGKETETKAGKELEQMGGKMPEYSVKQGDVWHMGKHMLVCANPTFDTEVYAGYLQPEKGVRKLLMYYPDAFIGLADLHDEEVMVIVHPNKATCGFILDNWVSKHGVENVKAL